MPKVNPGGRGLRQSRLEIAGDDPERALTSGNPLRDVGSEAGPCRQEIHVRWIYDIQGAGRNDLVAKSR